MEFNKDFMDGCSTFWTDENSESNRDESRNGDGNPVGDQAGLSWGRRMIHELTHDDIRRLEFGSEGEAYSFYSDYAKQRGFAVRKDDIEQNENGDIVKRYLVCNKEGTRDKKHLERKDRVREAGPITRVQCTTRIRVYLDMRSGKWKVSAFHDDHNHELTPPTYVHMIPAYRRLSESDKAQIDTLHAAGVRTCHIMSFMIGQKGGHGELGFCKKDMYNHIDKQKRANIEDGDAFAALCYLQGKWVQKMYDMKRLWENSYMGDTFYGGIRTTSVCEEISSFIKRYVQNRNSLVNFLHNFDKALKEYRHNELISDFKSFYGEPVLTTSLFTIEECASKVFTRKKFWEVKSSIESAAAYNVVDRVVTSETVRMFESCGIPCRHIFCAMKNEHVKTIPSSLKLKRWTKSAKPDFMSSEPVVRRTKEEQKDDERQKLKTMNLRGRVMVPWEMINQRGSADTSKGKRRCVSPPSQTSFDRAELQGLHDKVGERQAKQSRRSNGKQKNKGVDGAGEEMKFGPGKMGPGAGVNNVNMLPTSLFPHFPSTSMYPPPPCPRPPLYAPFYGYGSYGYYGQPQ
ncbi:FAR1 DNA-binding domain [Sesbania bispinosa]|nr:FAR1 DNA-binding domain [Sesbania bispinosa]